MRASAPAAPARVTAGSRRASRRTARPLPPRCSADAAPVSASATSFGASNALGRARLTTDRMQAFAQAAALHAASPARPVAPDDEGVSAPSASRRAAHPARPVAHPSYPPPPPDAGALAARAAALALAHAAAECAVSLAAWALAERLQQLSPEDRATPALYGCDAAAAPPPRATLQPASAFGGVSGGPAAPALAPQPQAAAPSPSPAQLAATEAHYRAALEKAPNDALLLRNYARFVAEALGDTDAAEPLLAAAAAAAPDDGELLAFCARAAWEWRRDGAAAASLFDAALAASPHDCYVLAAYSAFLWEWEDGEPPAHAPERRGPEPRPRAVARMERAFWRPDAVHPTTAL